MIGNRLGVALLAQSLLFGCGKSRSQHTPPQAAASALASVATSGVNTPGTLAPAAKAAQSPEQLLEAWTAALNAADLPALSGLYADKVEFYGQSLSRDDVVARKRKALAAAPGFKQQVIGQATFKDEGDSVRVTFQKHSGPPNAQSDVRSSLSIAKAPRFEIREETDAATEKRFSSARNADKPDTCEAAVWALVDSTRFAKQLSATIERNLKPYPASADLHQGGVGPFMPSETGGTFEIWMGVHHPERFENYASFSVSKNGETTVTCGQCEAPSGPLVTDRSAVEDFKRLCANQ